MVGEWDKEGVQKIKRSHPTDTVSPGKVEKQQGDLMLY